MVVLSNTGPSLHTRWYETAAPVLLRAVTLHPRQAPTPQAMVLSSET
jgi:hypothetical protein